MAEDVGATEVACITTNYLQDVIKRTTAVVKKLLGAGSKVDLTALKSIDDIMGDLAVGAYQALAAGNNGLMALGEDYLSEQFRKNAGSLMGRAKKEYENLKSNKQYKQFANYVSATQSMLFLALTYEQSFKLYLIAVLKKRMILLAQRKLECLRVLEENVYKIRDLINILQGGPPYTTELKRKVAEALLKLKEAQTQLNSVLYQITNVNRFNENYYDAAKGNLNAAHDLIDPTPEGDSSGYIGNSKLIKIFPDTKVQQAFSCIPGVTQQIAGASIKIGVTTDQLNPLIPQFIGWEDNLSEASMGWLGTTTYKIIEAVKWRLDALIPEFELAKDMRPARLASKTTQWAGEIWIMIEFLENLAPDKMTEGLDDTNDAVQSYRAAVTALLKIPGYGVDNILPMTSRIGQLTSRCVDGLIDNDYTNALALIGQVLKDIKDRSETLNEVINALNLVQDYDSILGDTIMDSLDTVGADKVRDDLGGGKFEAVSQIGGAGWSYASAAINCIKDLIGDAPTLDLQGKLTVMLGKLQARQANLMKLASSSFFHAKAMQIQDLENQKAEIKQEISEAQETFTKFLKAIGAASSTVYNLYAQYEAVSRLVESPASLLEGLEGGCKPSVGESALASSVKAVGGRLY